MSTMVPATASEGSASSDVRERDVVDVVRALALEVGGPRAVSAVTPTASLERDIGLGSLERVELSLRLERRFGRELDDRFLLLDTPRVIVRALQETPPAPRATTYGTVPAEAPSAIHVSDLTTLTDALTRRAAAEPKRVHVYLDEDRRAVTYGELHDGAKQVAAGLQSQGMQPGDRVAIMLPTGLDYLQTFMGIVAAGGVAVPLYPPSSPEHIAEYVNRQARILANAEATHLVAIGEVAPLLRLVRHSAPALKTIVTPDALRSPDATPSIARSTPDSPVLIQYTSGSTGDPKGVLLTHANVLANIRAIDLALALRPTDVAVSWLPLYHDMGLIGTWLNALVQGIPLALMSPLSFLGCLERWLWAIHQHRGTISPAPNFAYEMCARQIRSEAIEGLDLSSWRVAASGSEPVSPITLDRFARRFEKYGFRREAFLPVYGLAESAAGLCFPPLDRGALIQRVERGPFEREGRAVPAQAEDTSALSFVSVGSVLSGHELRLVDEQGADVPEATVGRLIFRGPSCCNGYYRNPDATGRALLPGGWMDSGDLAYRSAGEIFITGRVKDLVIKGGRHLVPQEIEEAAGTVEGIRKGCVAALGVHDETLGTERLVILAESEAASRAERRRLAQTVIACVRDATGVPPDAVEIVAAGTVPKTASGKVRRAAARDLYLSGRLGAERVPLRIRAALVAIRGRQMARHVISRVARGLNVTYMVFAWSIALILVLPVAYVLMRVLPEGRPVRIVGRVASRIALFISGCRLEVEGIEHLPDHGPLVLAANHTSYADAPALVAALPIDFVFASMREILEWPVVGAYARRAKEPTVDRRHPQESVADLAAIEARLRAGETVLFFPEGRLARAPGLLPFRLGAFDAAIASGAPVIPIALHGTRAVLPAGRWMPRSGRIRVWIGPPIPVEGTGWTAALAIRDQATAQIAAHCTTGN